MRPYVEEESAKGKFELQHVCCRTNYLNTDSSLRSE